MEGRPGVTGMVIDLFGRPFLHTHIVHRAVQGVGYLDVPGAASRGTRNLTAHGIIIRAEFPIEVGSIRGAVLGRTWVIGRITVVVDVAVPRAGYDIQESIASDLACWGVARCFTRCPFDAVP